MESPVVAHKPPDYYGKGKTDERGFPFEEEEGGAWSELAARHPDIAARLRPRPQPAAPAAHPAAPAAAAPNQQAFPRKRRPDHADQQDFGANFDGFESRFPFESIPPEFRGHFPSHWDRRYSEQPPHAQHQSPQAHPPQPQKQTIATQTEPPEPVSQPIPLPNVPQPAQGQPQPVPEPIPLPHLPQHGPRNTAEIGESIAPEPHAVDGERVQRATSAPPDNMSGPHDSHDAGNVRIIPIQVEGRDGPVGPQRATSPHAAHHPPHAAFEEPSFQHPGFAPPPPFRTGFNTSPRPYTSQKAYPQAAYARGVSPQRSHSPKPQQDYVEIPVQHANKPSHHHQPPPPQQQQPPFPQQQQQYQQQQQQKFQQQQQQPQRPQTPPPQPKPQPSQNDPITQILAIQTDVLNLMTEVENFTGSKKDKRYVFLDEMLTRNLLKLDNIETDGKENIRAARKEAIRCIQKCIAVLEAKAEKGSQALAQDVEMNQDSKPENGEVEMQASEQPAQVEAKEGNTEATEQPSVEDTRPNQEAKNENDTVEKEKKGKKTGKNTKKRDKSKDKANNKDGKDMQVDGKGDNAESPAQAMEVDGAASQ